MSKKYHIRDLEETTGIKAHTIRMWEKRYNIIEPDRSKTNIRYYDESTFKKFLLITSLYRSSTIKISEISKLSLKEIEDKVLVLNPPEVDFENWVTELLSKVINFDNFQFEKILIESIFSFNLDRTLSDLIFPFLHKIDTLWKGGSVTLNHKKFAFENVKRFLYNASYSVTKNYPIGDKKIILFSDKDEINSFLIMFADIVLRKHNYDSIFLNQIEDFSLLFEHIDSIDSKKIVTVAPSNPTKREKLINQIKKLKNHTFYLIDTKYTLDIELPNLAIINNLEELEAEI